MSKAGRSLLQDDREGAACAGGEHAPGVITNTAKACPSCGAEFTCNATSDHPCWCMDLPALDAITPAMDCLCPACLRAALAEQRPAELGTQQGRAHPQISC